MAVKTKPSRIRNNSPVIDIDHKTGKLRVENTDSEKGWEKWRNYSSPNMTQDSPSKTNPMRKKKTLPETVKGAAMIRYNQRMRKKK